MSIESNGKLTHKKMKFVPEIKFTKLFINGQFVDSISGFYSSLFICPFPYLFSNSAASASKLQSGSGVLRGAAFLWLNSRICNWWHGGAKSGHHFFNDEPILIICC